MIESGISAALKAHIEMMLPRSVALKHCEAYVAGVPDMSVSWGGTIWLEVKHLNPGLEDDGRQRFLVRKLSVVAPVYYVLYAGPKWNRDGARTSIVRPADLSAWLEYGSRALMESDIRYDHAAVCRFVREAIIEARKR